MPLRGVLCAAARRAWFFVLGALSESLRKPERQFRRNQAQRTKNKAQSTKNKAQRTKHQAPSTKHKKPGTAPQALRQTRFGGAWLGFQMST
jgi:hypothetical protein